MYLFYCYSDGVAAVVGGFFKYSRGKFLSIAWSTILCDATSSVLVESDAFEITLKKPRIFCKLPAKIRHKS